MKNRIYCTFILSIITVMVCAQTEQPKDSIKGHRETVPEIRQELHINDRNIQTDGTLPDNTRQAAAGDSMTVYRTRKVFRPVGSSLNWGPIPTPSFGITTVITISTFLPTVISVLSAIITLISA